MGKPPDKPLQVGKEARVPQSTCPSCGTMLDAVNVVGEDVKGQAIRPSADESFSVCIVCGHVMGFNADGTVRDLTDAEVVMIAGDRRLLAIQRARAIVNKLHPDSVKRYDKYRDPDWKCGTSLSTPRGNTSKSSTPTIIHLPFKSQS